MQTIRPITHPEAQLPCLLNIWESAVRATHGFLADGEVERMLPGVRQGLLQCPALYGCWDADGTLAAFMGLSGDNIDMLFVHADARGQGTGKALMEYALHTLGSRRVDVNEQNPQAIGFYERMGFVTVSRSPLDSGGRPYPILHIEWQPPAK